MKKDCFHRSLFNNTLIYLNLNYLRVSVCNYASNNKSNRAIDYCIYRYYTLLLQGSGFFKTNAIVFWPFLIFLLQGCGKGVAQTGGSFPKVNLQYIRSCFRRIIKNEFTFMIICSHQRITRLRDSVYVSQNSELWYESYQIQIFDFHYEWRAHTSNL